VLFDGGLFEGWLLEGRLEVVVPHVELSVPGPHPDVGAAGVGCELGAVVPHVELSVPGPHPGVIDRLVLGAGGIPVVFPADVFVNVGAVLLPSGVNMPRIYITLSFRLL
jgi:hypothetical protein